MTATDREFPEGHHPGGWKIVLIPNHPEKLQEGDVLRVVDFSPADVPICVLEEPS